MLEKILSRISIALLVLFAVLIFYTESDKQEKRQRLTKERCASGMYDPYGPHCVSFFNYIFRGPMEEKAYSASCIGKDGKVWAVYFMVGTREDAENIVEQLELETVNGVGEMIEVISPDHH